MSSHKRAAGLKSCDFAMSLGEIGQELGISRERVRQLEKRALIKAKQILERHGYSLQDLLDSQPEVR